MPTGWVCGAYTWNGRELGDDEFYQMFLKRMNQTLRMGQAIAIPLEHPVYEQVIRKFSAIMIDAKMRIFGVDRKNVRIITNDNASVTYRLAWYHAPPASTDWLAR